MIDKWTAYMEKARELMQGARHSEAPPAQAELPLQIKEGGALPRQLDKLLPGNKGAGAPGFTVPPDVVQRLGGEQQVFDFIKNLRQGQGGGLLP